MHYGLWKPNRLVVVGVLLTLACAFTLHAADFSHVHPNEIIAHAHEHQSTASVASLEGFTVHAEERSLWFFIILLVGVAAAAFLSLSLRYGFLVLGRTQLPLLRFSFGQYTAPPLALAFARGRVHQIE